MKKFTVFLFFALVTSRALLAEEVDFKVSQIVKVYALRPCTPPRKEANYKFGEFLFNTKVMSGDKDMACATCHLKDKGLADGLPLAIGVGGTGESTARLYDGKGTLVTRNAFSLHGRGDLVFKNFFWDGKVDSDKAGNLYSPFGNEISKRFTSPLSVAAILPLTERDEFLGKSSFFSSNEIIDKVSEKYYGDRYKALAKPVQKRLLQEASELKKAGAWDVVRSKNFEIAEIGNALASFIKTEFGCFDSKWNRFLSGENAAISSSAKRGAILFFGKARCVNCHTPPAFTDSKFHSIGVPQGAFGPASRERDLGRAMVTNKREDQFLFRTPPLVAVKDTAPYGHNGIFKTLEEVVLHHINPIILYEQIPELNNKNSKFKAAKTLASRDKELMFIEVENDEELVDLTSFLRAL